MKRVVVMNGQRILQEQNGGRWQNQKVQKAGGLKPGIYNISSAKSADKGAEVSGLVIHADKTGIYQKSEKAFVLHSRDNFDIVPAIGSDVRIGYDDHGKAVVSANTQQQSRSRSR